MVYSELRTPLNDPFQVQVQVNNNKLTTASLMISQGIIAL
ncbi:hypothetical protein XBO1_1910031 [Xenorhabdus bovienii str. oregonense]|uniref:Uncharacterized protein n=2 Tax=Xenorhabdus bovienii TaxID=40576 RepID=A0A077P6N7_XENBV|nr:hypothetical protein XBO1_1910031 [Xenorhabdus bovienii str. oregonense]CDH23267.1 hypothetical protein XBKB1_1650003 [Xenorhabdus bovienii str. kraussei Becker Underwood]